MSRPLFFATHDNESSKRPLREKEIPALFRKYLFLEGAELTSEHAVREARNESRRIQEKNKLAYSSETTPENLSKAKTGLSDTSRPAEDSEYKEGTCYFLIERRRQ